MPSFSPRSRNVLMACPTVSVSLTEATSRAMMPPAVSSSYVSSRRTSRRDSRSSVSSTFCAFSSSRAPTTSAASSESSSSTILPISPSDRVSSNCPCAGSSSSTNTSGDNSSGRRSQTKFCSNRPSRGNKSAMSEGCSLLSIACNWSTSPFSTISLMLWRS